MNVRYILLFFVLIFSLNGFGQISAPADFFEATEYSDSDYVFVFCTDNANGGSLIADDSTGLGAYDFEWYKFNETTNNFTDILAGFTINTDSTSSAISNLATGGYKAVLTNADTTQEYVAWIYINDSLSVEIIIIDPADCDLLQIKADPYYTTNISFETLFSYYDTTNSESIILMNKIDSYEWTHDNSEYDGFRSYNGPYTSTAELPTENTIFSVMVTDRFGCQTEDNIDYTAIETKADFSWTSIDYKTEETNSGSSDTELSGPAPLLVRFANESLNGQNYTWFFGDTLWNNDIDTIKTDDFLLEPEHTYYYTVADSGKTYIMRLFSESEYGCRDSIFFNINVEPSVIEFPNVFTPNNDGINDEFVLIDYKSIRSFKI